MSYRKQVSYTFDVEGEEWSAGEISINHHGNPHLYIEETRKNGQEDCHMGGEVFFADGKWQWCDGEEHLEYAAQYWWSGREAAEGIINYLNAHEFPGLVIELAEKAIRDNDFEKISCNNQQTSEGKDEQEI